MASLFLKKIKCAVNLCLDAIFINIASRFFALFNRYLQHRIQFAKGLAVLSTVKNIGINVRMNGYGRIIHPDSLIIGSHVRIGAGAFFNCIGGIQIGDNCQISRNVVIYSSNHDYTGRSIPYDDKYLEKGVNIGNSVWIGMGVCIMPGVSIGDGAIIGMGTVVSKNVPPMAIVVGAEQRTVKFRSREHFDSLNQQQMWFGKLYPKE